MKIDKLYLRNFRNYDELNINFNNKLNIIIGNNAQGKTNILEGIYFLSITKSFLPVNDRNCIKKDELFTMIMGSVTSHDTDKKLAIMINENGKKLEVNSYEIKRHSDYIGNLKVIIFNPDNIRLIKDAPSNRRRFLNIEISQLYSRYINILNEFNVILKQRNEYLKVVKNKSVDRDYLEIINEKFVDLSLSIYKYREEFINKINNYIGDIFVNISGYSGLKLKYITNFDISDDSLRDKFINKLKLSYDKEIAYGSTLYGPHRDDFSFNLENNDLLLYGSQGQLKMAVLALKLAEIDVFYEISGEYPLLLLDDLFSELDVDKRNKVINYLNRDIQTVVTTTDLNNIDIELIKDSYIYKVDNGTVICKNYDI